MTKPHYKVIRFYVEYDNSYAMKCLSGKCFRREEVYIGSESCQECKNFVRIEKDHIICCRDNMHRGSFHWMNNHWVNEYSDEYYMRFVSDEK